MTTSGLIGTEDYLVTYDGTEQKELTPSYRKITLNGTKVENIPVVGLIPVNNTVNGKRHPIEYKSFRFDDWGNIAYKDMSVLEHVNVRYTHRITVGSLYLVKETGELIYCIYKSEPYFVGDSRNDGYYVDIKFRRHILGTGRMSNKYIFTFIALNTVLTPYTSQGIIEPASFEIICGSESSTIPQIKGVFTIQINDKVFTFDTTHECPGITAGDEVLKRMLYKWDLDPYFSNYEPTLTYFDENSKVTVKFTQNSYELSRISLDCMLPNDVSYELLNPGMDIPHVKGAGVLVYKEIARNIIDGQIEYPSANYNRDGR